MNKTLIKTVKRASITAGLVATVAPTALAGSMPLGGAMGPQVSPAIDTESSSVSMVQSVNEKPEIFAEDIVVVERYSFNPFENVTAYDKEDGDITSKIKIVDYTVNRKVPGEYHITYSVTDSKGQETQKTVKVTVCEGFYVEADEITLKQSEVATFDYFEDISILETDLKGNVVDVTQDPNYSIAITYGEGSVTEVAPGTQETFYVYYTATNKHGVQRSTARPVTVTNYAPQIHAEDITVYNGTAIDFKQGIVATDFEDGAYDSNDISSRIRDVKINDDKSYSLVIEYFVTDSDGNTTSVTRNVTIQH